MTVPANATSLKITTIILFACALAGALIGAALLERGPETQFTPAFSTTIVAMQDGRKLIVQTREVTVSQWQECYNARACTLDLSVAKRDTDFPATGLSYPDTMEYIAWLNSHNDSAWRLPTAAEWFELAADVMPEKPDPIFTDPSLTWASTYLTEASRTGRALRPSGAFTATPAGIEDLSGNVWEWTQDCYAGASGQGKAAEIDRCPAFIMGGEHEAVMSYLVRDPARGGCAVGAPPAHLGMRLVSDVD